MRSRIHPSTRILVVAAAAMMAVAGCDSGGNGENAGTGANAGNGSNGGQASAAPADPAYQTALDFAKCMRANGQPTFPDPVNVRGEWTFPDSGGNVEAPAACDALARKQKQNGAEPELTAEDMTKLRQFAACMREKGFANYPDPDAQGNFPLPDDLRAVENDTPMRNAEKACESFLPPRAPK